MTYVAIDDAPFSPEDIVKIKKMGIVGADWGHPEVVLDDPVAYFKASDKRTELKAGTKISKPPRWFDDPVFFQ